MGGQTSDSTAVLSGVATTRHHSGAPAIFLCYINDLPRSIKSKVRIYADNTPVYNVINSIDDCIQLQNDLLLLERWASTWQMQINPSKHEFLAKQDINSLVSHTILMRYQ